MNDLTQNKEILAGCFSDTEWERLAGLTFTEPTHNGRRYFHEFDSTHDD